MSADTSTVVLKARVKTEDDRHSIEIEIDGDTVWIPMSEDKPNNVKSAFNKLLSYLKLREFQIELENTGEDLFSQVANQYLIQLNRELLEVHGEMKNFGLTHTEK